ncbi:MAG: hypothetical protein ACQGVC_16465 [Myxococcota bacterium]
MAKSRIPNPLERRHLVEKELPAEQALAIAEAYLAEERVDEAVEFLGKAEDTERLAALREQAVREGNAFLLRSVAQALGEPPERDEWRRLAEAADSLGKERYAEEARRQSERGDE